MPEDTKLKVCLLFRYFDAADLCDHNYSNYWSIWMLIETLLEGFSVYGKGKKKSVIVTCVS